MSYILEALKKSEKERRKEGVPDIQSDHSQLPSHRPTRKPIARWFAGVVVLLLGGGSLFWWQGQKERGYQSPEDPQILSPPVISPPPASPQVSVVSEFSPNPLVLLPESREQISQVVRQVVKEVEKQSRSVPPPVNEGIVEEKELQLPEGLPLLEELTPEIRNKIPQLSFFGHAYAEDTGKRLIMINNRVVREGDLISNGLSLKQITSDGVVLRYQAVVFQVKLF